MEAKAIIMLFVGIFLLYGGLTCCLGIAWYHGKILAGKKKEEKNE